MPSPTARLADVIRAAHRNARFMPATALAVTVDAMGALQHIGALPPSVASTVSPHGGGRHLVLTVAESVRDMSADAVAASLLGLTRLQLADGQTREHMVKNFLRAGAFTSNGVCDVMDALRGLPTDILKEVLSAVTADGGDVLLSDAPSECCVRLISTLGDGGAEQLRLLVPFLPRMLRSVHVGDLASLCPVLDGLRDEPELTAIFVPVLADRVGIAAEALPPADLSKFIKLFAMLSAANSHSADALRNAFLATCTALVREASRLTPDDVARTLESFALVGVSDQAQIRPVVARLAAVIDETRAPHLVSVIEALPKLGLARNMLVRMVCRRACSIVAEFPPPLSLRFVRAVDGRGHSIDGDADRTLPAMPSVVQTFAGCLVPLHCVDETGHKLGLAALVVRENAIVADDASDGVAALRRFDAPAKQQTFSLSRVPVGRARLTLLGNMFDVLSSVIPRSGYTVDVGATLCMAASELPSAQLVKLMEGLATVPTLTDGDASVALVRSVLQSAEAAAATVFASGDAQEACRLVAGVVLLDSARVGGGAASKVLATLSSHIGGFDSAGFAHVLTSLAGMFPDGALRLESPYLLRVLEDHATEDLIKGLPDSQFCAVATAFAKLQTTRQQLAELVVSHVLTADNEAACRFADCGAEEVRDVARALRDLLQVIRDGARGNDGAMINKIDWGAVGCAPAFLAARVVSTAPMAHPFELVDALEALAGTQLYTANPHRENRVLLSSSFFTPLAVRFIAVAHAMTPKLLVNLFSSLSALRSAAFSPDARKDLQLPDVALLRCLFARTAEVAHEASASERTRMLECAEQAMRMPNAASQLPEASKAAARLKVGPPAATAGEGGDIFPAAFDVGVAESRPSEPATLFSSLFQRAAVDPPSQVPIAAAPLEPTACVTAHPARGLVAEPADANEAEPSFADGGPIAARSDQVADAAWPVASVPLPDVSDPPREKFVDFGNDKFSIAAKPNLLLRFKPEATQSRSTQPSAPQPPSAAHAPAPASARAEPAVPRPCPPSSLTAPHDLAGSLVLD